MNIFQGNIRGRICLGHLYSRNISPVFLVQHRSFSTETIKSMAEIGVDEELIGAIDEGTTSARFFVFNKHGSVVASANRSIPIASPHPGWAEQDPMQILSALSACIKDVNDQLRIEGKSSFSLASSLKSNINDSNVNDVLSQLLELLIKERP